MSTNDATEPMSAAGGPGDGPVPVCPEGFHWDPGANACVPDSAAADALNSVETSADGE